jgi:hypothetical protein
MAGALYLLTGLGVSTSRVTSGLLYAMLGIGMGCLMQTTSVIVQNSVGPNDMGVASSARMFFQQIGGSMGVALFGAIFARRLTDAMSARLPGVRLNTSGGSFDPRSVNRLPLPIRHDVFYAIAHAVQGVFFWAAPSAIALFVLASLIREVPLRGSAPAAEAQPKEPEFAA